MRLALALAIATPFGAADFHFGIKGGVPLTSYFETGSIGGLRGHRDYSAATRRYTAGFTADYTFSDRLALRVDALYRRMGYVSSSSAAPGFVWHVYDVRGNSFDFPATVLVRVRRHLAVFAGGGAVVRYVRPSQVKAERIIRNLPGFTGDPVQPLEPLRNPEELEKRVHAGTTATVRIDIPKGRVTVAPEVRYTRWLSNVNTPLELLRFAPNQAEVLLGVTF
ncbi:MAG TPA: hypothetical protein VFL57_15220 [Bryobacteraceae bacterium]|nr:hypothetical protein [Bryobacteraceae bacterium]